MGGGRKRERREVRPPNLHFRLCRCNQSFGLFVSWHDTNKYGANFKLRLNYQSTLEISYNKMQEKTDINWFPRQICENELRKQLFVNRLVKIGNMLPDKVVPYCWQF